MNEHLQSFRRTYGENYLLWTCHAAFPIAVTPHLLYYLWANFQSDRWGKSLAIPWIAVADILFSGLFRTVGHELYQMERETRQDLLDYLLAQENLGQPRLEALGNALIYYVRASRLKQQRSL
jgi:hypothetical protein